MSPAEGLRKNIPAEKMASTRALGQPCARNRKLASRLRADEPEELYSGPQAEARACVLNSGYTSRGLVQFFCDAS